MGLKVDLPVFLIGLCCFVGAVGMMSYLMFSLMYADVDYDEYPTEEVIFGFSLLIFAISIMFYMGTYFIHTSQIDEKALHNLENI